MIGENENRLLLPKKLMAEAFGISVQAFAQWKVKPIKKSGREVLYSLPEVIQYRLERDDEEDDETLNLTIERARLAKAQADHEELKVDILKGKLLELDAVQEVWEGMVLAARAKFLTLPTKLAAQLARETDPAKVEALLREEVDAALLELAEYDPRQHADSAGAGEGDDEEDRPAASDHGKRVG